MRRGIAKITTFAFVEKTNDDFLARVQKSSRLLIVYPVASLRMFCSVIVYIVLE